MQNNGFKALKARLQEIIKFSIVGVMNTLVDFGVFALLTGLARLEPTVSHVISYSCGVINSYFFNRRWTFRVRTKEGLPEMLKFAAVNLVSLGISSLVFRALVAGSLQLNEYIGKLAATLCAMAINFLGSKLLVFRTGQ